MYQEKGLYRPYAKLMKETVNVPIICAGRMDNPDMALEAIENKETDMISLGRPLLADPDYVNKLRYNDLLSIRPCISCHEGCMGRIQEYSILNCAVNPQACREQDMAYRPILKPKKVMIVGGGVAGCEAARVLSLRGHQPVLFEKTDHLGGNLIPGGAPDFKEDDIALAKWYQYTLEKQNVEIHFETTVTKDMIMNGDYDVVIIATGSTPKVFDLGQPDRTFTAEQVLVGDPDLGEDVTVIGGGLVGCETALYLAKKGKKVTIVEALDKLLVVNGPLCHANSEMLERLIPFNHIDVITNAQAVEFEDHSLKLKNGQTVKADSVVLAVVYKEENNLYNELQFEIPEIYVLGDAKNVANIMYGIWDAFEVANHID